jgi:hypothetical protein
MAVQDCNYPILGKFKAVALVLADDCGKPIGGPGTGWMEHCPAAFTPAEDVNEGDSFTRECADGSILVDVPGVNTLLGVDVELDLHGASPEFISMASGSTPVTQNGTIVGWDDCKDGHGSLNMYLWREIVGESACDPETGKPQYLLDIYPWVDQVRITDEGTYGGSDGFIRVSGRSRTGHLFGTGGLEVFEDDTEAPECMEDPIPPSCMRRRVITTLAPPEVCGLLDVEACDATPEP